MEKIPLNYHYTQKAALLIYQGADDKQFYVEHHDIELKKGKPTLMNGKPLTREHAVELFKAVAETERKEALCPGLLPESILSFNIAAGAEMVAWWEPSRRRHLSFTENLGIRDGALLTPPLFFVQKDRQLYVFALAENQRPTGDTELLNAPFHNVYSGGNVCMGSAAFNRQERGTLESWMNEWSKGFWTSRFSALHNSKILVKGNINAYLDELIAADATLPFDTSRLNKAGKTVNQLLKL